METHFPEVLAYFLDRYKKSSPYSVTDREVAIKIGIAPEQLSRWKAGGNNPGFRRNSNTEVIDKLITLFELSELERDVLYSTLGWTDNLKSSPGEIQQGITQILEMVQQPVVVSVRRRGSSQHSPDTTMTDSAIHSTLDG